MRRRGWIVAGIVVVAIVVAILLSMQTHSVTTPPDKESSLPHSGVMAEIRTDSITELLVEFGDVPYGTMASERIRLRNSSDKPIVLTDYQATCRCTTIDLPRTAIAPNEWAEAEVMFDSRGEFGTVGNYIEVATSDPRCKIGIWTCAEVIN